jgi:hypothetical protein
MSMYQGYPHFSNGALTHWPRVIYSNDPPSALALYCNDWKVRNYRSIGSIFDIDLRYLRME